MFSKILRQLFKNKFTTAITLLIVIIGGYFGYQAISSGKEAVRYTVAAVERGTLIVSVSGSGQVSASDQVDIKPKVSGDVVYVGVKNGQEVKAGTLLAQIDIRDAKMAVQNAEISLETARVQLEDLLEPPDELTLLQAENSLAKAKDSKQKAEDNIVRGYEDAFNAITDAFFDLPIIITGTMNVLNGYEIAQSERTINEYQTNESVYRNSFIGEDRYKVEPFIESAKNDYSLARTDYDQNLKNYKSLNRYSENEVIEAVLDETIETIKSIAEAVKSEINLLDVVADYFSSRDWLVYGKITNYQSDLKSFTSKTNSYLSSLLKVQRSFQDNRQAVLDAEYSVREKELSLEKLIAGPDELDIRAKKITIQQKEDALIVAQENLAGCYIYAPFDGIVAEVYIKKGDSVSSGTKLLTLVSQQKIADISLNEIDAANIKVGQKATFTFDALPEVSISGEVIEVDAVGQVSQGVVSYGVKIAFDTDVEQVKPGMSITTDIITEAKQDVLVLPNSAIKSQGDSYYVELVEVDDNEFRQQLLANVSGTILPTPPKLQPVETGLSNDLSTEVVNGLKESDIVITSTISPNAVQTTQTRTNQNQGFKIPGINTGSGAQMKSFR